ncbi:hypothetical protein RFM26_06975 [Mesorhizobium sp. VK23B]|uniref:Uncharacterized protein n=1 Tax=Mesorhizobium dulcispinae TaxID=3072316 RepID=A0ABU4XDS3_9HYPH|nr:MULTISPECIES: hypothetical protein [unclassified Mesorhizobium]MDX8465424.1 hypothetical protein [Mesorhizobium sp. VK23B]MDX8472933.1 hypothetical protein [Mesorhizobium sp. VK23A]MDX8519884.1 hypothetical protein [Mesorhizobium sp. VK23D]
MRTDADQERRNARYPACGRVDRKTAGLRSIACGAAPSVRWQIAPRRFERCTIERQRTIDLVIKSVITEEDAKQRIAELKTAASGRGATCQP